MSKIFLTQLQEKDGEAYVELPPEFMCALGWKVDDIVGYEITKHQVIRVHNLMQRKHDHTDEISARPIDKAIVGQEEEYEEEIDLYKTYGGD